ncbi:TBPIP-domain-containing protein [Dichomitus squalens]|uniref:TBPIP-domain-containing protein n=1 Tax=Dichomitus squalens TaxID=114155 RepID=A0A4Q9QC47_9APHY|nr:TBPIP-domain-containing protein [Dichomitus squalens]TBU65185.1 TBPIP-domain-containing protein [Dichomitus squalens]
MATKAKPSEAKVPVLKGKEAEDKVLEYMKKMNRPFGAVDVSANLKGSVPKAAAQKILVSLSERGELVQKTCGKTTFFVANQANLEDMPTEKLAALESEYKKMDENNKQLVVETKMFSTEVNRLRSTPTDKELASEIVKVADAIEKAQAHLEPLRAGTRLVSAEETAQLDSEWTRWRNEWTRRRKIFLTFWSLVTDTLTPQQATELGGDLGIEHDTAEHGVLEKGALCSTGSVLGKRRR